MRSSARCPLDASRRRPDAVILPSGKASAAATSSRKGSSSPTSCRDSETRESRMRQLPRQHAARLANASPEGKIAAAGRGDGRRVGAKREKFSTIEQPKQSSAVDTGERFGAVAAEQVERPPAQPLRSAAQPSSRNRPQSSINRSHR